MKKLYYILSGLFICMGLYAQIGIMSERPQGVFMVDGAKDDPSSGTTTPAQIANNVYVSNNGQLSIGITPSGSSSLLVGGPITIQDGNQAQDRLLVSDANGKAEWKSVGELTYINGYLHPTGVASGLYPNASNTNYQTGSYIDLPPGTYAISLIMMARTAYLTKWNGVRSLWARMSLSDSPSSLAASSDFINSMLFSGNLYKGGVYVIIKGTLIMRNTTPTTKRYYLITWAPLGDTSLSNTLMYLGSGAFPENKLYAIRLSS